MATNKVIEKLLKCNGFIVVDLAFKGLLHPMCDNVQTNESLNSIFAFQYNVQFQHDLMGHLW